MPKTQNSTPDGKGTQHRKADGEIRAGKNPDVAPVRLDNPTPRKPGNGPPPRDNTFRKAIIALIFLSAFAVAHAFAAEPAPTKTQPTLTVEERKANLEKQARDALEMIKMGQLLLRNAQLEYDAILATTPPSEVTAKTPQPPAVVAKPQQK